MMNTQESKSIENKMMYQLRNRDGDTIFTEVDTIDPAESCWKYNSDNSVELNSVSGYASLFVLPFYDVKQGDVIEATCEVFHKTGEEIRMGVDIHNPTKNNIDYVGSRKSNEYETLNIKITVPEDNGKLFVTLGIWKANVGRGIIRNFRATLTTKRQTTKPFRHANINNRDSDDGSFILTEGRANDPATIEQSDGETLRITFEDRLEFGGSGFTNQEYYGAGENYIARTSYATANSMAIRFYDISGAKPTAVPIADLPKNLFVAVMLIG